MKRFNNREECYRYYAKIRNTAEYALLFGSIIPIAIASIILNNIFLLIGGAAELALLLAVGFIASRLETLIANRELKCLDYPHWWEA